MIGVVVALPEELKTLTPQRLGRGETIKLSDDVMVALAGVGAENAKTAAENLVKKKVDRLVSWGCAAALIPDLKPGDLTLAECCVVADGKTIGSVTGWAQQVKKYFTGKLTVIVGQLAESQSIVSSGKGKAELGKMTGAIALDMESAAIARVAVTNGLPFLAVRAIADPLGFTLPEAVSRSVEDGQVHTRKLVTFLLTHPLQLPALLRLGLYFHAAQKTLKIVAHDIDCITHYKISKARLL